MASPKMVLVQEHVSQSTARKLAALARAVGCSRSKYVARLLQAHVRCVRPALARTLEKTSDDRILEEK